MEYKKYELGNYNIHTIKTDENKFKTISVQLNFRRKVKKEEITIRNFLTKILIDSTAKYKTNKEMNIAVEDLYGIEVFTNSILSGNYSILNFCCQFLNEKFTEEGMNYKSLDFFLDTITNPNVDNGEFNNKSFEETKRYIRETIEKENEKPSIYANKRMLEEMDKGAISYSSVGYLEDIDTITPKTLLEYYNSLLTNDIIDIFVIGDIDSEEIKNTIVEKLKIKTFKKLPTEHFIEHTKFRKIPKTIKEKTDNQQSNLSIGLKIDKLNNFERQYTLSIYNYIFGGGPDSKLFQVIREENSLCYTVNSAIRAVSEIMIIKAGINRSNYDKTLKLIKKLHKEMLTGKFTDSDVEIAVNAYTVSLKEMLDSPFAIISNYASKEYLGFDLIEKRLEEVKKVKKEDIVKLGKKIKMDTIFLLEGVIDEED